MYQNLRKFGKNLQKLNQASLNNKKCYNDQCLNYMQDFYFNLSSIDWCHSYSWLRGSIFPIKYLSIPLSHFYCILPFMFPYLHDIPVDISFAGGNHLVSDFDKEWCHSFWGVVISGDTMDHADGIHQAGNMLHHLGLKNSRKTEIYLKYYSHILCREWTVRQKF